ncbi:hypothetical protein ADL05_08655 [Nocardiopsis sp. NRRL B-16309]|nr:hypothetical protein ADL05_08655 [Nocardiopsis sp. NRRL B-16309]
MLEMREHEGGSGDIPDLAGAGGDVPQQPSLLREQREPALAQTAHTPLELVEGAIARGHADLAVAARCHPLVRTPLGLPDQDLALQRGPDLEGVLFWSTVMAPPSGRGLWRWPSSRRDPRGGAPPSGIGDSLASIAEKTVDHPGQTGSSKAESKPILSFGSNSKCR